MNITAILLFITAVINTALGTFIYRRNPKNSVNQSFAVFTLILSFWTICVYMGVTSWNTASAFFWIRMSFVTAIFIPAGFYFLASVFPEAKKIRVKDLVFFAASSLFIPLLLTSYCLKSVTLGRVIPRTEYGALFPVYVAYFLSVMCLSLFILARKWNVYRGIRRLQIQYVFLGIFLELVFATVTNFVSPILGIEQTEGYGPLFTLLMTICIVYAIAKYHLMDIIIIIRRTTLYALLTASVTIGYVAVVFLTNWLFGGIMGIQTLITAMIPALLIAFAFAPLKEGLQVFIDKTLFKKRYEHRKILGDLSKILTSIFSLEELLSLILRVITTSMGIENGVIYLPGSAGRDYVPRAAQGNGAHPEERRALRGDSPLIKKLLWRRELIIREQLERLPQSPEIKAVTELLEKMKADICIPIYSKEELTGILFFGNKETGETFTSEDIEMFTTLSHHIAVAIENAQLYTKVEESKRYQEILMNNLTSGVVAVDLNSRITAFNSRAESILRMPARDTIGRGITILPAELRSILSDTLDQRESYTTEEVMLKLDGNKELPLAISSSIFNSADGKTLGALIVFSDLTERKVLETEMRRADRLASLGTLAAGMAHEIKNPLVSLKTFTQLLPQKYFDKEFREDFAKLANQEVDRINYLVEQLLDFARPSSPMFKTTDLRDILNNTLFLLGSRVQEQNTEVKRELGQAPLHIMADGDQLKQVFLNILINALQAMEHHGILIVRTTKIPPQEGAVSPVRAVGLKKRIAKIKPYGAVMVEITDSGKGIDPKDLPHLFDPFFTTKEMGVGLGLAIAHSIIEEHGGIIDVKSRAGKGTSFFITLPLAGKLEGKKS